MSTAGTWHRIGGELARHGWDCRAVDLPGHGGSPPVQGPLDLDALVAGVVGQLTEPVEIVVGHSLGAVVALALVRRMHELASRMHEITRALVLEDPPGSRGVDMPALAAQIASDAAVARDDVAALRRRERAANPHWDDADVEQSIAGVLAAQAPAIVEALGGPLHWDLPALVAATPLPTLVLAGREGSGRFPCADGGSALNGRDRAEVQRAVGAGRLVVIDGGGHCLHRDAPDRWLAAVLGFIGPAMQARGADR
jgi:pimeloyl-ACP methyl ester carboxylesterase